MDPVELSQSARHYLDRLFETTGETAILLSINSKGCGGHAYQMDFVDPAVNGETINLGRGRRLIIDHKSLLWLIGTRIDYQDDGLEQRVVFTNPLEAGRCGCGMSFVCRQ